MSAPEAVSPIASTSLGKRDRDTIKVFESFVWCFYWISLVYFYVGAPSRGAETKIKPHHSRLPRLHGTHHRDSICRHMRACVLQKMHRPHCGCHTWSDQREHGLLWTGAHIFNISPNFMHVTRLYFRHRTRPPTMRQSMTSSWWLTRQKLQKRWWSCWPRSDQLQGMWFLYQRAHHAGHQGLSLNCICD